MEVFFYKAVDHNKQVTWGSVKAENESKVKAILGKKRLLKIQISTSPIPVKPGEVKETWISNYLYRDIHGKTQIALSKENPNIKDLTIFTKQLATMISSGVQLIEAFEIIRKQQKKRGFSKILYDIQLRIEEGDPLSKAMENHPTVFDTFYVSLIQAGEKSGKIDDILQRLSEYIEKSAKLAAQVKSALIYPISILIFTFLTVAGLMVFVVPTFAQQYAESGKELPFLTKIVVDMSDWLIANWMEIIGGSIASTMAFMSFKKSEFGANLLDRAILKAPIMGPLVQKIAVGRFSSTLSSMLNSGVDLLDALEICSRSSSRDMKKFIGEVIKDLEDGEKLSDSLGKGHYFPEMVISMIEVGETTGSIDEMLNKVNQFYEEEVDEAIKGMMSMIEPVMLIVIGGAVGFIVIAMYLPVFDMGASV